MALFCCFSLYFQAITSTGTKKCDLFLAGANTQLKFRNVTTDIKVDINSNISTSSALSYAGISSSIGLTANPIVNFSGVLGTNVIALGTDISFDTKTRNFTKCNARLSFTNADLIASLALHVGNSINASYYHIMNPSTNTVVGAEVTHSFSTNVNTITVGTQHALDPLTTFKVRVNHAGKASTLIQHKWHPKSLFTISGEVDTKSINKSPKVRLALALKP
ncbi:hypothetical protein Golob_027644 [Gossypium lobatum]|uniref:Uncharacterized protein n=2 Tax=Gossypium lobatum TaxID=34289 RepID=A0A7J8NIL5_9ROSI|nr:hypothetical protein [Gossypium lobatum]